MKTDPRGAGRPDICDCRGCPTCLQRAYIVRWRINRARMKARRERDIRIALEVAQYGPSYPGSSLNSQPTKTAGGDD